jgi:serine/threonine protein kinase
MSNDTQPMPPAPMPAAPMQPVPALAPAPAFSTPAEPYIVQWPAAPLLAQQAQPQPWNFGINQNGPTSGWGLIVTILAVVVAIVGAIMLAIPMFRGIGWLFRNFFFAIGWLVKHVFTFVRGVVTDAVRAVGAVLATIFFVPLAVGNVVIGRWSAASHFGRAIHAELHTFGMSVFRIGVAHPARLLLLGGLTEGIEKRVPDAMRQAPGADSPPAKVGQFDGYTIIGSLPTGGSGAKVYVAEPTPSKRAALARAGRGDLAQVVIKSFSLRDGSTMPQIVRESRALESARKLGLILDHELNDERFYYAMPFVPGDSLAVVTRKLHAEAGMEGLRGRTLAAALKNVSDLLSELSYYHRGGLWHKDVKPDNIIVNEGKAHLVDLGLVTPLRSSMTLTTHGTEYFRDPELVRMALRGAKVNEVDGVKFDLYGVGAVLYSVIENSFPAHGALSQITKTCPEALRWVIRRSMAEMHQRYASADEMLADLSAIATATDPFALKPIDLPSMGGGGCGAAGGQPAFVPDLEPRIEPANFARTTPPPVPTPEVPVGGSDFQPPEGFVFKATVGVGAAAAAAAATAARGRRDTLEGYGNAPQGAPKVGRPKPTITLTDWWTGAYRVEGERVVVGKDSFTAPSRRNLKVERMPRAPGRTATEQLQAARERVAAAQKRIQGRPYRSFASSSRSYNNGPNAGVFIAVGVVLLSLGLVFFQRQSAKNAAVQPDQQPEGFDLAIDGMPEGNTIVSVAGASEAERPETPEPPEVPEMPELAETAHLNTLSGDLHARVLESVRGDLHAARDATRAAMQHGRISLGNREQSGEEWLDTQVRRTKAILDARHPDNKDVTFASVASAAWEAFTSNPTGKRTIKSTATVVNNGKAETPEAMTVGGEAVATEPPPAEAPSECARDEKVLLVTFLNGASKSTLADRQALLLHRLNEEGFCVLGRGASTQDVELLAGAKSQIGTASPADEDARERLRVWLNTRQDVAAVLWISNDDRFNPRLVLRSDLDSDAKQDIRNALSGSN